MFSDNLLVYDVQKRRWERRTPKGVGWFPHLCLMIDVQGNRTDALDQYLKLNVEDPAAPALKKLATGGSLEANERSAVALFVALTAARSPQLMNSALRGHLDDLTADDRTELDVQVKQWCDWMGRPYSAKSHIEYLKPSSLGAMWNWSLSLQHRCCNGSGTWNAQRATDPS